MSLKSVKGAQTAHISLLPLIRTATAAGTAVDTLGCNSVTVVFLCGTWTDGTHTLSLTECDTSDGSFTAVAAGNIDGTLTAVSSAATDDVAQQVGLIGKCKRYIKAVVTVTGSPSTGATIGAGVILGNKNKI